jgi:hypothetical protein
VFGQYARGERPIYRGRLEARDNFGENGGTTTDGVLADGAVWAVAWLRHRPDRRGQLTAEAEQVELVVVSEAQQRHLDVFQIRGAPGETLFSAVTPFLTYAGSMGRCRGCLPSLFEHAPATIDVDADAREQLERYEGRVRVKGTLTLVHPNDLTLAMIVRANRFDRDEEHQGVSELARQGDALVRGVRGRASEPAEDARARAGSRHPSCLREADYVAEWWADPACLGRHGVRNVVVGDVHTRCCEPYRGNDTPGDCIELHEP